MRNCEKKALSAFFFFFFVSIGTTRATTTATTMTLEDQNISVEDLDDHELHEAAYEVVLLSREKRKGKGKEGKKRKEKKRKEKKRKEKKREEKKRKEKKRKEKKRKGCRELFHSLIYSFFREIKMK